MAASREMYSRAAWTIGFALIGYVVAATFFAPHVEEQRVWGELFTVTPVAAALLGYMLHRGTESVEYRR